MDPLILVAPLVGAWIEITLQSNLRYADEVAPLVGAWIEISKYAFTSVAGKSSLLSWERGLKSLSYFPTSTSWQVAPLVGAWIEIFACIDTIAPIEVAPLVGAWIEITTDPETTEDRLRSLLSWERGLKFAYYFSLKCYLSRSSRGSVDWNTNKIA